MRRPFAAATVALALVGGFVAGQEHESLAPTRMERLALDSVFRRAETIRSERDRLQTRWKELAGDEAALTSDAILVRETASRRIGYPVRWDPKADAFAPVESGS